MSFQVSVFVIFEKIPRSGIIGSYDSYIFNFLKCLCFSHLSLTGDKMSVYLLSKTLKFRWGTDEKTLILQ